MPGDDMQRDARPRTHCEVHVQAPLQRIWELVTDIRLPARFSPELQRVAWLDGVQGPAVGARFEGHNQHPRIGEWRTVSHVVELDERRVFAWAVTDADGRYGKVASDADRPLATWRYELHSEEEGVRLRQAVVVGPGRSGLTKAVELQPDRAEQIVAFRLEELRSGMETTLREIKKLAEQPA
ncbi:SRPBCC family protein [Streptomyces sp. NK08204]|uniref:SRPBCC family protein n=1 Tax=Streptomyces sp. NK08204 TaxID=2873260 RepID=UPI0027E29010|nr:SRPBCC family protein [Streptomyces sp. NK08204]